MKINQNSKEIKGVFGWEEKNFQENYFPNCPLFGLDQIKGNMG